MLGLVNDDGCRDGRARGHWRDSLLALALAVGHQVVAIREQLGPGLLRPLVGLHVVPSSQAGSMKLHVCRRLELGKNALPTSGTAIPLVAGIQGLRVEEERALLHTLHGHPGTAWASNEGERRTLPADGTRLLELPAWLAQIHELIRPTSLTLSRERRCGDRRLLRLVGQHHRAAGLGARRLALTLGWRQSSATPTPHAWESKPGLPSASEGEHRRHRTSSRSRNPGSGVPPHQHRLLGSSCERASHADGTAGISCAAA